MFTIRNILNSNNPDDCIYHFPNITAGEIKKFKYAKMTTCNIERSFSKYKNVLRSNRRSFTSENVKHHVIVSFDSFKFK